MIKTGNPVISIYTEMTPNPETMKFVANKLLYPGKSIDFPDVASAKPSPLAQELFGFPFIKAVFIASNFVTLTKTPDTRLAGCNSYYQTIFKRISRRRQSCGK